MTVIAPRHTNYKVFSSQCLHIHLPEAGRGGAAQDISICVIHYTDTQLKGKGWCLQEDHTLLQTSVCNSDERCGREEVVYYKDPLEDAVYFCISPRYSISVL